ncbi:MAG: PilZ domain-containing protein [Methylobacter sp.]
MTSTENTENRHFHRILYAAKATLSSQETSWDCEIIDLSLKGCLLNFDTPWANDLEAQYELTLELSEDVHIKMQLAPTHVIGNKVGFKCEHIDIDSISELRRLVELNLGDSKLLERDLLALSE